MAESVTLVTALNPIIGYEKAALIAKTALATGGTIADTAEPLGIMSSRGNDRIARPGEPDAANSACDPEPLKKPAWPLLNSALSST